MNSLQEKPKYYKSYICLSVYSTSSSLIVPTYQYKLITTVTSYLEFFTHIVLIMIFCCTFAPKHRIDAFFNSTSHLYKVYLQKTR